MPRPLRGGSTAVHLALLLVAGACSSGDPNASPTDAAPGGQPDASPRDAAGAPDAGAPDAIAALAAIVEGGEATITQAPRSAYGGLLVASAGERSYVVESRRDVEPGPFGIPWRVRFRLAAYDGTVERWSYDAEPDDVIGDVVIHPSGDVTLSVLRFAPERLAYQLVRLTSNGSTIGTTVFPEPVTIPESDYASTDPRPLFRMTSDFEDATAAGWLRLLPDGEGLVVAFLSFIDTSELGFPSRRLALGVGRYDWQAGEYRERWARVVDGMHFAQPVGWTYDELRWRQQAMRPFLARDDASGDILVGRAWNNTRCAANVRVFAELTSFECILGSVSPIEVELLPLAVTRFDAAGRRLGTRVLAVDDDAAEQVPFALAARQGELAVVGAVVRERPDGSKRTYLDPTEYVDYDGYIAVYDAQGVLRRHHDFNLGRGDMLAGMRWTDDGIVAVGAAGWNRWLGGMSISRGADPLVVWLSPDASRSAARVIPLSDGTRHFNLHDVTVLDRALVAFGFSDAPMTHSADGGNEEARTFGPLRIRLGER